MNYNKIKTVVIMAAAFSLSTMANAESIESIVSATSRIDAGSELVKANPQRHWVRVYASPLDGPLEGKVHIVKGATKVVIDKDGNVRLE